MQLIGFFVVCCVNVALVLFVLGLLLGDRGAHLRRMAFVAFACALLPSILGGLAQEAGVSLGSGSGSNPLGIIAGGIIVAVAAYGVLQIRRRRRKDAPPPRIQMKRPYTHRQDADVISLLRERIERDE